MAKKGAPKGSGSKYTIAASETVCAELAEGKPLRQICREMGISWVTVYNWKDAHPGFAERFARAREIGEDAIAAECLEIANTPLEGIETTEKASGVEVKRGDMLGHRKLQIDTRLKLLAKWNPSKWGDKVEQTHKGDPGAPVQLVVNGSDVHG